MPFRPFLALVLALTLALTLGAQPPRGVVVSRERLASEAGAQVLREGGGAVDAAVDAPRFHHQWLPDRIQVEADLPASTQEALKKMGHALKEVPKQGCAQVILSGAVAE